MGVYRDQLLPRFMDRACGTAELDAWRSAVTAGLEGRVLEIGFGSGHNLAHYPRTVEQVLAVEPSRVAWRLAGPRIAAAPIEVEHLGLDGQAIPLADASVDAALSTFTLCSIPDVALALGEVRRVLRPGGRLQFLEHCLAPDAGVAAWQRRLEPLQLRLCAGCHLTRDVPALIEGAGFALERLEQRYGPGARPWSWFTVGVAVKPAPA